MKTTVQSQSEICRSDTRESCGGTRVLLNVISAVRHASILELLPFSTRATTRRCADVAVGWKYSAEAPVTTTGVERIGVEVGE